MKKCPFCDGTGIDGYKPDCCDCYGTGWVEGFDTGIAEPHMTHGMLDTIAAGCCNETCPRFNVDMPHECDECRTAGPPCSYGVRGSMKHGDPMDCRCPQHSEDRYADVN